MKTKENTRNDDFKVILSELKVSPFAVIKVAFALMGVIPVLILFYVIIGKHFLYQLFLGNSGLIIAIAIFISIAGFLYAYNLVSDMVKKLLAYSAERKRSDDEKTELIFAISHDLKTPLTVIKTGIKNLLEGIGGVLNNVHRGMAEMCLNAADRIAKFIDELLNISKAGFIRMNFRRNLVDFEKIIRDEINGISELVRKNRQNIRFRTEAKDSNLWGDAGKLSRAVMNLLSNAVKYTPEGGRIEAVLSADENTVKLAVINTGPGIETDKLDKIFNRYERLKKHSDIEGTGLGLSITKDIVDLHKGHLTARSEPGRETEFDIILPRDLRSKVRMA